MMRATPETAFSPPLRESDSHAGLSPNLAIRRIPPEKTSSSSSSSSQASPSVSLLKMKPNSSLILAKAARSEEHTSELQSQSNLVCRLLLEKKKNKNAAKCCEYDRQDHSRTD